MLWTFNNLGEIFNLLKMFDVDKHGLGYMLKICVFDQCYDKTFFDLVRESL